MHRKKKNTDVIYICICTRGIFTIYEVWMWPGTRIHWPVTGTSSACTNTVHNVSLRTRGLSRNDNDANDAGRRRIIHDCIGSLALMPNGPIIGHLLKHRRVRPILSLRLNVVGYSDNLLSRRSNGIYGKYTLHGLILCGVKIWALGAIIKVPAVSCAI